MADSNRSPRLIGYARVSTTEQNTALQIEALQKAGVAQIFEEKQSAIKQRPVLEKMLANLEPGDILVVYKLDRLARSITQLVQICEVLRRKDVGFRSLTDAGIDTETPQGRLMMNMMGAFAEFERELIRERSIAGQVEAYRRGVRWGGTKQPTLSTEQAKAAQQQYATGKWSMERLGALYGVSRSTISRTVRPKKAKYKPLPVLGKYVKQH